jgi:Zn-dependent peptidase ImmA (M78 family)
VDRQQLVVMGMGAAHKAHQEFGINPAVRVDVFRVLRNVGAYVFFRPLRSIYGAYLPTGTKLPGLLINSNLPLSVQRFTAAHEFGHMYLKHKTISLEQSVGFVPEERSGLDNDEIVAETFGAFFLMPKPLVVGSMRELGVQPGQISPSAAYLLSLRMGTSYKATVNQLQTLKLLRAAQANELREHAPKEIKEELNDAKSVGRHDVWLIDESWNGKDIFPAIQDTIRVRLEETPTSGFTWLLAEQATGMELLPKEYRDKPEEKEAIGGPRIHEFVGSLGEDAKESQLVLRKARAWEPEKAASEFAVKIHPQEFRKTGPLVPPKLT